jgi:hypothetical protein
MSLKDRLVEESLRFAQNPAVSKLVQDPRFMQLVVAAMSVPGRLSTFTTEQRERFAREMGLVTADDLRDVRRRLGAIESTLEQLERRLDER